MKRIVGTFGILMIAAAVCLLGLPCLAAEKQVKEPPKADQQVPEIVVAVETIAAGASIESQDSKQVHFEISPTKASIKISF